MQDWSRAFTAELADHAEHHGSARPMLPEERGPLMRAVASSGLVGQDAGPPGFGPEPRLQHEPGADLLDGLQSPAFLTVEQMFRVLPEASWFGAQVSPSSPIQFELGAVKVPPGMAFIITDYEFVPLRQSGLDPFDFIQAEPYRFSGYMGFDVNINGRRASNLLYQLDPQPVQFEPPNFGSGRANASKFSQVAANSFASVSGGGTSLLPVRSNVQGPRNQPFTMYAMGDERVVLSATIFRRVMTPIASLQGSVSGYSLHMTALRSLVNRMRPR